MLSDHEIVEICNVIDRFRISDVEEDKLILDQHKVRLAQQLYGKTFRMSKDEIKKKVFMKFCEALYVPGKAYGHISASSNSEPATQKVLKSSHSAGSEGKKGNATGELISCSKNPRDNWIQTTLRGEPTKEDCERFINQLIVFNYQTVLQPQPGGDTFLLENDMFKIDFSLERMIKARHTIFDCVRYLLVAGIRVRMVTYTEDKFTVHVSAKDPSGAYQQSVYQLLLSLNVKNNGGITGTSIRDVDLLKTCLINWTKTIVVDPSRIQGEKVYTKKDRPVPTESIYYSAQLNTFFHAIDVNKIFRVLRRFCDANENVYSIYVSRDVMCEPIGVKIHGNFELSDLMSFTDPSRFYYHIMIELTEGEKVQQMILGLKKYINISETTCSDINVMYEIFGITATRHFAFKRWIDLVSPNGEVPQAYIEMLLSYCYEQGPSPIGIVRAADKTRNPLTLGAEENILKYVTEGSIRAKEYPIDDMNTQILTGTQAQSYGLNFVDTEHNTQTGQEILADYNMTNKYVSKVHVDEMKDYLTRRFEVFDN